MGVFHLRKLMCKLLNIIAILQLLPPTLRDGRPSLIHCTKRNMLMSGRPAGP